MNKRRLVETIQIHLAEELATLVQAAKAAHEAATHEESKAEDQHDTRGLEASYLAGAQASRAAELRQQQHVFRTLALRDFGPEESIGVGALVELEIDGKRSLYLLLPIGG